MRGPVAVEGVERAPDPGAAGEVLDALAEAVEDLKKVELLDQREHTREVAEDNKAEQSEYDEMGRLRHMRR